MKYYVCEDCGSIITFMKEAESNSCCGSKLSEIIPGTSDGAAEKHVPVVEQEGQKVTVSVGSVDHPMIEAHYIEWVVLETKKGMQKVDLHPEEAPKAEFLLTDGDEVIAAYAYCNLHGLWKSN